jgi:hypothetical protein
VTHSERSDALGGKWDAAGVKWIDRKNLCYYLAGAGDR